METAHRVLKRQFGQGSNGGGGSGYGSDNSDSQEQDNGYDEQSSWWWTPAGMATRYAIVALIFAAVLLFLLGGYYHAQKRIRRGLAPRPYHRWMVRSCRYQHSPHARYQSAHYHGYAMDRYPPPPPAYNVSDVPPPVYQPPDGASKAMADQNITHIPQPSETHDSGRNDVTSASRTAVTVPAVVAQP